MCSKESLWVDLALEKPAQGYFSLENYAFQLAEEIQKAYRFEFIYYFLGQGRKKVRI